MGKWKWLPWLSASLLLSAAGCVADVARDGSKGDQPASDTQLRGAKTQLLRATSCDDLLTKIQNDAIAKLDLSVARAKQGWMNRGQGGADDGDSVAISDSPNGGISLDAGAAVPSPVSATPPTTQGGGGTTAGTSGGGGGLVGGTVTAGAPGSSEGAAPGPTNPVLTPGDPLGVSVDEESDSTSAPRPSGGEPTGASGTNTQVADVDEADFIKVVNNGRGMFLLHGNSLRKLKTYPPEELSLEPAELKVEGNPSEMFVTDDGRAVIFSSVYGYSGFGGAPGGTFDPKPVDIDCVFDGCSGGYAGNLTKITIADVSGDKPTALRELYYQGNYVSSRRYDAIVRVILQGERSYDNLYQPEIDGYDPWGRPYESEVIDQQLGQWRDRIAASVRNTKLSDWVPSAKELKDGTLVEVPPSCDSYFVPQPGFADSGLVQVLSIDAADSAAAIGGVAVVGRASTVYSSVDRLVLAQPDYRWMEDSWRGDFGFIDEQRTTLHAFALSGADTKYLASGWVPGHLPQHNQQFGLDVTADHTLRIATSGRVRANPNANPGTSEFWQTETENLVLTLAEQGTELKVQGQSDPLGHAQEVVQSARFVGDRAYVVTFRQTDPLIVLDVSDAAEPVVLGEIEIPGFSQYMHPLDENHLITFGRTGTGGSQLQLFDVTDPLSIPAPKTLDFGGGSSSETAFNHKAFTFYAPLSVIALPVTANRLTNGSYAYTSALRVIRVDAQKGFELLGSVDHSAFADASYGCFSCGPWGCSQFCYAGSPEVRRGHFVENSDAAFVYAIGYGGVTVNDLEDLTTPIATVKLPGIVNGEGPWYTPGGPRPGGVAIGGGVVGPTTMPGTATPPPVLVPTRPVAPEVMPRDAAVMIEQDAGAGFTVDAG